MATLSGDSRWPHAPDFHPSRGHQRSAVRASRELTPGGPHRPL